VITTLIKGLIPGSLLFLILGQLVGVALLFAGRSGARWGRRWLAALLALYWVLSLQGTSDLLIYGLSHRYRSLWTPADAHNARVVVVLGNGARVRSANGQELSTVNLQSAHNALEGARLYRMLDAPIVVASGGVPDPFVKTPESDTLAHALQSLGVPAERIVVDPVSRNTWQQATNIIEWLRAHGEHEFVLVTSPEHMFRAEQAFIAQGLPPRPSLSSLRYGGAPAWRPTLFALQGSEQAIYEYLAIAYYQVRGRLP